MTWILIFTLYMDRGGGPATAVFADKEACQSAITEISKEHRSKFSGEATNGSYRQIAICVPSATPKRS